ncbi:DUF6614 family protein [Luteolibacter marinus]|uniref:DUF6614 family protein n=1 Tax=Luteolibacter marinus TaxID=2776705 RepID=UPI001867AE89|nr:DUF6614 family protein [Luteolibacter marinus]
MHSYHVFFNPKSGVDPETLAGQVHAFMASQLAGNLAASYRLLRIHNKAGFDALPEFQLIVDYASAKNIETAFANMRSHFRDAPHGPLMSMVDGFRVAFSHDASS